MLVDSIVGCIPKYALVGFERPPSIAFVRSGIDGNKNDAVRTVVPVGVAKKVFAAPVSSPSGLADSGWDRLEPVAKVVICVPPAPAGPVVDEPESNVKTLPENTVKSFGFGGP